MTRQELGNLRVRVDLGAVRLEVFLCCSGDAFFGFFDFLPALLDLSRLGFGKVWRGK
jgi:hypothetical protein